MKIGNRNRDRRSDRHHGEKKNEMVHCSFDLLRPGRRVFPKDRHCAPPQHCPTFKMPRLLTLCLLIFTAAVVSEGSG